MMINTINKNNKSFISSQTRNMLILYSVLTITALRFNIYLSVLSLIIAAFILLIALFYAWRSPHTAIISALFFYCAVSAATEKAGLFRFNESATIFLIIVAWYSAFTKRKLLPFPKLIGAFYFFAFTGSVWVTTALYFEPSYYLAIILSLLGMQLISSKLEVRECAIGAWIASFIVALSGLYFGLQSTVIGEITRLRVGEHDQNYFSLFGGLAFILSIAIIVNWHKRLSKTSIVVLLLSNIPVIISLSFQGSRSFVIASLLPLLVCAFAARRNKAIMITSIICLLFLVGAILFTSIGELWMSRFLDPNLESGGARVEIWTAAQNVIQRSGILPFILGSGYGTAFERVGKTLGTGVTSTHNSYISILIESGLVGLICYITFFIILLRRCFKYGISNTIVSLAIILYMLVQSISLEPHRFPLFWLLIAISYAQTNPMLNKPSIVLRKRNV